MTSIIATVLAVVAFAVFVGWRMSANEERKVGGGVGGRPGDDNGDQYEN